MSWTTEQDLKALIQAFGLVLFIGSILWYVFPYLPDQPPKKNRK